MKTRSRPRRPANPKDAPVPTLAQSASAPPPGATRPPSTDDHLVPLTPLPPSPALAASASAARSSAEASLALAAPDAVAVITTALATADLDTKLDTAWRVLDKARVGGPASGSTGLPAEIGPVLGEALRGAFAGLAAGLGLSPTPTGPSPKTPPVERDVTKETPE